MCTSSFYYRCLVSGGVCLAAMGCGGGSVGNPVAVMGTVTLNAKPLPYARIEFQSLDDERANRSAFVKDGKFSMPESHGLPAGEFFVCVLPYDPELEELTQVSQQERKQIMAARKLIPEKYHQTGELKANITPDEPNTLAFHLK